MIAGVSRRAGGGLLFAVGVLLLAESCSSGDRLAFFASSTFVAAHPSAERDLEERLAKLDLEMTFQVVADELPAQAFIESLSPIDASFVVATPLLADEVAAAAPVLSDRRFMVLYGDRLAPRENVQRLTIDRSSTFYLAGRFAATFAAGPAAEDLPGAGVLVLAYVGSDRRERELEAFIEGFGAADESGSIGGGPEVREFKSLQDERTARRTAVDLRAQFDVVMIMLGPMNAEVLRGVALEEGGVLMTEAWFDGIEQRGTSAGIPGSEEVVAWIAEDWVGGIAMAVDSRNPRVAIPSGLVAGPAAARFDLGSASGLLE